jgi:hypothetical protein
MKKNKKKKRNTTRVLCKDGHFRHYKRTIRWISLTICIHCKSIILIHKQKNHCCGKRIEEYSKAKQFEIWRKHGKADQS